MAVATRMAHELIAAELDVIRRASPDGVLYTRDVVSFAENPDTALHNCFEWDDRRAGYAYRLWQARQLIRTMVTVLPSNSGIVSAYVSLTADRKGEGGYRAMVDVLSDQDLHQQMLEDALVAFLLWEEKYKQLLELMPVFEAAESVRKRYIRRGHTS